MPAKSVRLPSDSRFESNDAYLTRDDNTGDIVLSNQPEIKAWEQFFEFMDTVDVPKDFMKARRMNHVPKESACSKSSNRACYT